MTPADDLNACYGIAGKVYRKGNAKATVDALDFAVVYLELVNRFKNWIGFIGSIVAFLA